MLFANDCKLCSCHKLLLTESDMSHFIPKQKSDTEGITLLTQDNLNNAK